MPEFKKFLLLGALLAGLSIMLGAFAAHGLEKSLDNPRLIANFDTAARYQFYHALGLIAVFILSKYALNKRLLAASGWAMLIGSLLFSGSLYVYVLSGVKAIAMITPIGGLIMFCAWVLLFLSARKLSA